MQSLRDNWQAIRRGEVEFGEQRRGREQPPSARRDNSDSEEDNVPLAVRFAQARAKRALQQERQHREQRAGQHCCHRGSASHVSFAHVISKRG